MTLDIHHLGLTVTSLEEGRAFFVDLLGWDIVREDSVYPSLFVSNCSVMITLWQTTEAPAVSFNPKTNIGLHHFAIRVESAETLAALYEKISLSPFDIEAPPSPLRERAISHFFVYGPNQIRVEFIHVPT